jgi:hypothetical protein
VAATGTVRPPISLLCFQNLKLLKGRSENFLNVVAAHIEGLRYPPKAYLTQFLYANVCVKATIFEKFTSLYKLKFYSLTPIVFYSGT